MLWSMALLAMVTPVAVRAQANSGSSSSDSKAAPADSGSSDRGGRGDRGNRGPGGGFDPAQFRQRMEDRIKEQLGANDDEWKVIQPKLDKVVELRFSSMRSGFSSFRGRSGDNGGSSSNSDRQRSAVEQAQKDLQETLDNKDASPDQIKAKLTALRDAREKAKQELASAQKDLKEVLTQRQEAMLVNMNMLE
jgi:signal recognition particle GTPase